MVPVDRGIRHIGSQAAVTGAQRKADVADLRKHVVHRGHILTSVPDWWGGPMRAVLFWWFFATADRDWWARFLDRFGAPFLEGRYNANDDRGRYELEAAFSAATRLFGIVVSDDAKINMHQANTQSGGDAFEKFAQFANREISKLVLGQTSSADVQQSGLNGGGQGKAQSDVRDDIRRFDSTRLAHTVRTQILGPLWQVNGWTMPLPAVTFGAVSDDQAAITIDLLAALPGAGLSLTDDGLATVSERFGVGLRFAGSGLPAAMSVALAAAKRPALLPSVSRRAARAQQARGAVESLASNASPKLARIFGARAREFEKAILDSDSPEEAAANIAALTASYDPTLAAEIIEQCLVSASANAALTVE